MELNLTPEEREKHIKSLDRLIKKSFKEEKIICFAESLYIPWKYIFTGSLENPSLEEIQKSPGSWVIYEGATKPFAHIYQRKICYPWEYPDLLERWKHALFFIWDAGNRGGKSTCLVNFGAMLCLGIHPLQELGLKRKPPLHGWVVSPNLPSDADVPRSEDTPILKKFYEWVPDMERGYPYGLRRFYRKDKILAIKDKGGNESIINFKSYDQEKTKMKSEDVDFILFDEEMPLGFWEEGKARIIDRNGLLFLVYTPDFSSAHTYSIITKERNNPKYYISAGECGAEENPFLSRDIVKEIQSSWSINERSMRKKGEHIQFKGKVFPFEYNKHVGKPFIPDKETTIYVIIDWHPVKPVIITYLAINTKEIWYVFRESVINSHTIEDVSKEYYMKLTFPEYKLKPRKNIIDKIAQIEQVQSGGYKPKSIINMLKEFDIHCVPGRTEFEAAHTSISKKFNNRELWFDPQCEIHIEQFDTWGAKRYLKGNEEGTLRDQLEVEGNDTCINLVYAYNAGAKWIDESFDDWPVMSGIPDRPSARAISGRR